MTEMERLITSGNITIGLPGFLILLYSINLNNSNVLTPECGVSNSG